MVTFQNWLVERTGPGPTDLIAIIGRTGSNGISRKELGAIITLPAQLLNALLAAYCNLGLLQANIRGDETVYWAQPSFSV
jgi:hypothetical protein